MNKETPKNNPEKEITQSAVQPEIKTQPTRHTGSAFWAIVIVSTGLILLLNNFNLLPWSVWGNIWRFWPLLLILWGLQLIFGRNWWSNLLISIIGLIVIAAVLALSVASINTDFNNWATSNFTWWHDLQKTYSGEQTSKSLVISGSEFQNITSRSVQIDIGSSEFSLTDPLINDYFQVDASYPEGGGEPRLQKSQSGTNLDIKFDTINSGHMFMGWGQRSYDLKIGQTNIPTSFDIDLGSGSGNINFQNLVVTTVKIDQGSGIFNGQFNLPSTPKSLRVDLGSGQVNLNFPPEVGLRVRYKIGSGQILIRNDSLKGDGVYNSSNYDSVINKLDAEITIGSGKLIIK